MAEKLVTKEEKELIEILFGPKHTNLSQRSKNLRFEKCTDKVPTRNSAQCRHHESITALYFFYTTIQAVIDSRYHLSS